MLTQLLQHLLNIHQHIDLTQKVGVIIGSILGFVSPAIFTVIINTAVGAVVGFIVTTLCRFVWEVIKRKYNASKKNREIEEYFNSKRSLR